METISRKKINKTIRQKTKSKKHIKLKTKSSENYKNVVISYLEKNYLF